MSHPPRTIRRLALRATPAILWMGLIFALSSRQTVPTPPTPPGLDPNTIGHFVVYAILAAFIWWALGATGMSGRRRLALAFMLTVLYGVSDEWHQSFVPGRRPDVYDVLVDAIGAACGLRTVTWLWRRWPELPVWRWPDTAEPPEFA